MARKTSRPSRRSTGPIPKARHVSRSPATRIDVTRAEYNRIIGILNDRKAMLNALREALARIEAASEVQFKRIAQLQAELDEVKRAWANTKAPT
jgi:Arc/MetJ family transcription regulator